MKKVSTSILLLLYLAYFSGPFLNKILPDDSRANIKLCISADHHLDLRPCNDDCSQNEFSSRTVLLSQQQHLVSSGTRVQFMPLDFILPDFRNVQSYKSVDDHLSNVIEQPITHAAPVFLMNRVLRI
ncbi:MAG: hypothetical protein JST75_04540 [Bacteroidetes bacterium]|nr:hypothetical protein [Bacteroidota bacterium]